MRIRSLPALLLLAIVGCGSGPSEKSVALTEERFRVTLGLTDTEPTDWSGSLEAAGGRIVGLTPWRFDKEDAVNADASSWKCSTRRAAMLDPQYWWLGAIHIVPKDMKVPVGEIIPNGFEVTVDGASEVRVQTAQGAFPFQPAQVRFGAPLDLLGGRVRVERLPAPRNLTAGDGMEDDYPAVAVDSAGVSWLAWVAYKNEKETLFAARLDGAGKQSVAEGEFFRPALTSGSDGRVHLAVSVHTDNTWKIGFASGKNGKWDKLAMISAGGPDLFPRLASDAKGGVWVVWQGYRDGRSRILARRHDGSSWQPEIAVSDNARNAWEPAIAADPQGRVHFVWDAYDDGNYNVYYRMHDGQNLSAVRPLTSSRRFQAHAAVACDRSGRPWIAWDEAGADWGKDTGFVVNRNNGAQALYEERRLRMVVLADDGPREIPAPEGFLEQPQLSADAQGNVWCLARRRYTKLHEVWSQSLQRNRLQQYSFWDYVVASHAGAAWSPQIALPESLGRNDLRASLAAAPEGRAAVAWAGDGRVFSKPYPFIKNNVFTAEVSGASPSAATLKPFADPDPAGKAVHPAETEDVARMRNARIEAGGKQLRVLRGDMHRHTDLSFDGDIDGSLWDFYRYVIDAADFDYAAVTDHNAGDDIEYFWWIIQKSNDLYHYPGRFTPVYAYERSLRFPNGHRNLIWSRRGVRSLPRSEAEEAGTEGAARLYDYLRKTGGLAMSHTSGTLMGTDWRDNDKDLEPLVEIYQGDRTSYEHEGAPRAARGGDKFSQPGGYKPEGFVWNAWAKGYKLGVQASSDHASTHISYAVLLAEDNTRDAILRAVAARHAYAATDNIVLDVRSGGHIQGDIFATEERPKLVIRVQGTAPIDRIDVVKNNQYVFQIRPGKTSLDLTFDDTDPKSGESYYYVRVQQRDGQIAWSSPLWITYGK